ncbi:hypothetical protein GCM10011581_42210 [Saccharopolyspora subtropica]|uniref:Uncharacterized protein n=1 Tax=Saccharopolyspora thermophila TaxID=89367 RepID=A0A917K4E1_9PSEU|nr:hypothetical protein [Saccharopolyspora subtropica]GGJ00619.1 hypothetical protein GCM10011581_42210 [Saccharopolyspora subtropica]
MVTGVFDDERQNVFWIVGSGMDRRHATTIRPGAVYAGQVISALCEQPLKIPQATPNGRMPRSKAVTDRCEECARLVADADFAETAWDF